MAAKHFIDLKNNRKTHLLTNWLRKSFAFIKLCLNGDGDNDNEYDDDDDDDHVVHYDDYDDDDNFRYPAQWITFHYVKFVYNYFCIIWLWKAVYKSTHRLILV